ncbi:MAG: type II toxin-antitoxin system VapB family antitoxin [Myxococcota bacterium]
MSNTTQAVRLPKSVALPAGVTEVDIVAEGQTRLIVPAAMSWDVWFRGPRVTDDFMVERMQESDQTREAL